MILLTTDWGQDWTMAGISVGVVFAILVLLVIILQVFSAVAAGKTVKPFVPAPATGGSNPAPKASDADDAAVATAVYLYLNGRHDEESGILTIHVNEHSLWHEELNDRL